MADPRYFDLTSRIDEAGIEWPDLAKWLACWSIHPFTPDSDFQMCSVGRQELADILKTYPTLIVYEFWWGKDKTPYAYRPEWETNKRPSYFKVHVGSVELFCKYLGLRPITIPEAVAENLQKPHKLSTQVLDSKKVIADYNILRSLRMKEVVEREKERYMLFMSILNQELNLSTRS